MSRALCAGETTYGDRTREVSFEAWARVGVFTSYVADDTVVFGANLSEQKCAMR